MHFEFFEVLKYRGESQYNQTKLLALKMKLWDDKMQP